MVCLSNGNDPLLNGVTDCVTENPDDGLIMDGREDDAWLETHLIAGFRVWQILLLAGTILTTIVTFLCCCIRFRIPRTKQEIESDWERREMAREFERRMKKIIGHEEGSKLDLRKGDLQGLMDISAFEDNAEKYGGMHVGHYSKRLEKKHMALERVHADVIREEEEKRKKEMEDEVRIRIREGANDGTEAERARRWKGEHGGATTLDGTNCDGKGAPASQNLGWKTTGMIARVFFNANRREKK